MNWSGVYVKAPGGVIPTDADPNTLLPSFPDGTDGAFEIEGDYKHQVGTAVWLWSVSGGCTVTIWVYESNLAAWLPVAAGVAVITTAPVKTIVPNGAKVYIQVTANAGSATKIVGGLAAA